MKKKHLVKITVSFSILLLLTSAAFGQKRRPVKQKVKSPPIIFAVINDGKTIEPMGMVDKGNLEAPAGGDSDAKALTEFTRAYYQPNTVYRLVFGASDAGTVTVKSSNSKADCSKNMATVTVQSARAKLKGNVMALATSAPIDKTASGVRRLPTSAERAEIETLVRAEFAKNSISANDLKTLKYQNLTALDVDNDKKAEMVGSFWVETATTSRALLFFIADKTADGKFKIGYSDFNAVKQEDLIGGGEIQMVDEGIYHELLLDALEYDGDTSAEIFTYVSSFEGASFNAYSRRDGKWEKAFEGSNYHCAF